MTGTHPYGASETTRTELVRATLSDDPAPASGHLSSAAERRRVRGDVDAIIARALSRDSQSRYATAAELAADVRRFLGNFPVQARPATRFYVAHKFSQRHWGGVLSVLLTLLVLAAATVITTLATLEARRQRDFARTQLARAEALNDLNRYVLLDAAPGQALTARDLLGRALHVLERQKTNEASRVAQLTSIGWEYEAQNDHASGLRVLNEAYGLSRGLSDPSARAQAACALANSLANERYSARSEALIEQGLRELPPGAEFALDRYFCLSRANQVAVNAGDAQLAIARSQAALAVLQDAPFDHELAELYGYEELASALREAGRYREANAAFAGAWTRLVALGRDDTSGAAIDLGNWALVLYQLGRPLEAEKLLRRALELEQAGTSGQPSPMLLSNYAQMLLELGKPDQAETYAARALERGTSAGSPIVVNQARLRLARIYRARGEPARATQMLDQAERSMSTLLPAGHFAFGALAAERALIAQQQGDTVGALKFINQAMQIDEQAGRQGNAGAQFLPILLTYRAGIELDARQLSPRTPTPARRSRCSRRERSRVTIASYTGRAYLTLARVLNAEGRASEADSAALHAAQQLEKAVGADHPETRSAAELSRRPT